MTRDYVVIDNRSQSMPNVQFAELIAAVLSKGKPFRFQAKGFSMSPFIQDEDIVTLSPLRNKIKLGEVIASFESNKRLYLHRVVKISHEKFLIRGDNVSIVDGWQFRDDMLGYVTRIERQSKNIRFGLGSERVIIAILSARGWLMPIFAVLKKVRWINNWFSRGF